MVEEVSGVGTAFKSHRRDYFYSQAAIDLMKANRRFKLLRDMERTLIEPMNREFKDRDAIYLDQSITGPKLYVRCRFKECPYQLTYTSGDAQIQYHSA